MYIKVYHVKYTEQWLAQSRAQSTVYNVKYATHNTVNSANYSYICIPYSVQYSAQCSIHSLLALSLYLLISAEGLV